MCCVVSYHWILLFCMHVFACGADWWLMIALVHWCRQCKLLLVCINLWEKASVPWTTNLTATNNNNLFVAAVAAMYNDLMIIISPACRNKCSEMIQLDRERVCVEAVKWWRDGCEGSVNLVSMRCVSVGCWWGFVFHPSIWFFSSWRNLNIVIMQY